MSSTFPTPMPSARGNRGVRPPVTPRGWLGYNGQLHEPRGCWQFLGNGYRIYNPVLMRFHSPDSFSPFGEGDINAYAYCSGDPVNNVDPTGEFLQPLAMLMGISSVVMGGAAVASNAAGNRNVAAMLGTIAGVLGAASMVTGLISTRLSPLKQGDYIIHRSRTRDVFEVHADPHAAQVGNRSLDGREMGVLARNHGLGGKPITMAACRFAPQGQEMANVVGVPVTAYPGSVWLWGSKRVLSLSRPVVFQPAVDIRRPIAPVRIGDRHRNAGQRRAATAGK